jgi:hypothetical protein
MFLNAIKEKILNIIKHLHLDLTGKVILTEAATGAYVVTPIIAAVAGAKVYAYTKNTSYGTVEDVKNQTSRIAQLFDNNLDITIIESLTPEIISQADIITNSGHLRPLDSSILKFAKREVVISYMYEAWEVRSGDVDLNYCSKKGVKVVATNERHPSIDVFNYLGEMAIKLIHDSGKCLYRNKFIIISNNDFGHFIAKTLVKLTDKVGVFDKLANKDKYPSDIIWLGEFPNISIPKEFLDAEGIIFTAYPFEHTWMHTGCEINLEAIRKMINPFILRFDGHIDTKNLDENNIDYFPKHVKPGHMGVLLSDIGYDSVIRLQAGGLKAGDCMLSNCFIVNEDLIGELI